MKACNHAISTHSYKYCKMKVVNWAFCYLQCGDVWLVLLLHLSLSDRCFPCLGSGCHRLGLNELVLRLFTLSNKAELTKSLILKYSILFKSKYHYYFAALQSHILCTFLNMWWIFISYLTTVQNYLRDPRFIKVITLLWVQ